MEPDKKSNGAMIGSIVIILILVIGGLYVWKSKANKTPVSENESTQEESDLNALEQDLNSLDTSLDVNVEGLE